MIFWLDLFFFTIALSNALFWPRLRRAGQRRADGKGSVSVLIPARDEEVNITGCLESVLAQPVTQVLVYDDHSSDRTSEAVRSFNDPRLTLLPPAPLPSGWYGKTFACSQLASQATSDWLLFLDADARLCPGACESMIAEAVSRRLTMLSCWPGFDTKTFWETALMPLLNWVVFSVFPGPLSLIRSDRSLALAHGACLLFDRGTYERLGGHSAVRGEIFEDTRLAQLWRSRGERALALDGQDAVRVRMYGTLSEIWLGFRKNFFRAFRHPFNFWLFLAVHFAAFVLPFLMLNWSACCLVLCARAVLLLRFRQSIWTLLLHPFAELFLIALGIASWRAKGVSWKGRQYT